MSNGTQTNYLSIKGKDKALRSFETSGNIVCRAVAEEQPPEIWVYHKRLGKEC